NVDRHLEVLARARRVSAERFWQAVERDHQLMDRAFVPGGIQRKRAIGERTHGGEVHRKVRSIEAKRDRRAPRRGCPVEQRNILFPGFLERDTWILQESLTRALPEPGVDPAKTVASRPQVVLERTRAKRGSLGPPARIEAVGLGFEEGIAVLRETTAR